MDNLAAGPKDDQAMERAAFTRNPREPKSITLRTLPARFGCYSSSVCASLRCCP
jgi:hypothetical protein